MIKPVGCRGRKWWIQDFMAMDFYINLYGHNCKLKVPQKKMGGGVLWIGSRKKKRRGNIPSRMVVIKKENQGEGGYFCC